MRKKVFGVLQRIGRSFMLPIAVLPIAGMFLGIGSSLTNEATIASLGMESILGYGTILNQILTLLMAVGQTIFDNLPLIFDLKLFHIPKYFPYKVKQSLLHLWLRNQKKSLFYLRLLLFLRCIQQFIVYLLLMVLLMVIKF